MTNQSLAQTEAPAQDRFVIFDDNSVIVQSMHGTFYDLQFSQPGGRYTVPYCSCPSVKECRHRRKLKARLLAPERVEAKYPGAVIAGDEEPMRMQTEEACGQCKEFIADLWAWLPMRAGAFGSGYMHLFVCGCGVRRAQ